MKIFLLGISALVLSLAVTTPAEAQLNLGIGDVDKAATKAGYGAADETTLAQNIGGIIKSILTVSGVIFTGLIFYAGYLWMLARGDEGQVQKSKDIIETAIVGLVIALASYGITNFVMNSIASRTVPGGPQAPPSENEG